MNKQAIIERCKNLGTGYTLSASGVLRIADLTQLPGAMRYYFDANGVFIEEEPVIPVADVPKPAPVVEQPKPVVPKASTVVEKPKAEKPKVVAPKVPTKAEKPKPEKPKAVIKKKVK